MGYMENYNINNLDIRYKENKQTNELVKEKGPEILDTTYTASGTAENVLFAEMYKEDGHGDLYRTKQKYSFYKKS